MVNFCSKNKIKLQEINIWKNPKIEFNFGINNVEGSVMMFFVLTKEDVDHTVTVFQNLIDDNKELYIFYYKTSSDYYRKYEKELQTMNQEIINKYQLEKYINEYKMNIVSKQRFDIDFEVIKIEQPNNKKKVLKKEPNIETIDNVEYLKDYLTFNNQEFFESLSKTKQRQYANYVFLNSSDKQIAKKIKEVNVALGLKFDNIDDYKNIL